MKLKQEDIRLHWDRIKDSLSKTIQPDERIEDIYHQCLSKRAFLFVGEEGYIIAQELFEEPVTKVLHIWIAYGVGQNLIDKYKDDIDELAKSIGATKIRFRTQRKGFERAVPEGWSMRYTEYEKRIV